jgi:hypothetical protein
MSHCIVILQILDGHHHKSSADGHGTWVGMPGGPDPGSFNDSFEADRSESVAQARHSFCIFERDYQSTSVVIGKKAPT